MLKSKMLYACAVAALFTFVPMNALGSGLSPAGPVLNGDFESPFLAPVVSDSIEGTAADRCIGVGHQVFYGSATWQHKAVNQQNPQGAAQQIASDPDEEARKTSGFDHCVSSGAEGSDSAWISPVAASKKPAVWSHCLDSSVEFGYDLDSDAFDREARILADSSKCNHNMWQSYAGPGQAFSLNFDLFEFTVEDGAVDSSSANIQLGFSLSPGYAQHPWVGVFWEGALHFDTADLLGADGKVALAIGDADILCPNYPPCHAFRENFTAAGADEKAELLGQTRLIQLSFWNFNRGATPVVIDDVAIVGATTVAEELARGNVNPNPML